jgi:hypothetical protein
MTTTTIYGLSPELHPVAVFKLLVDRNGLMPANFKEYYVGLTDATKKNLEWKYELLHKPILDFYECSNNKQATEVMAELLRSNFKDLGTDPLSMLAADYKNCINIFIMRHWEKK